MTLDVLCLLLKITLFKKHVYINVLEHKGTVPRDFSPQLFFYETHQPRHLIGTLV
jgi:hypothetical protein